MEKQKSFTYQEVIIGLLTQEFSSVNKFEAEIIISESTKIIYEIYVTNDTIKINKRFIFKETNSALNFEDKLTIQPGMFEASTDTNNLNNLTWFKFIG